MLSDRPKGSKLKISEVRCAALADKSLMSAIKDESKLAVLMEQLEDHRSDAKSVARVSNKSAAVRSGKFLGGFSEEVSVFLLSVTA